MYKYMNNGSAWLLFHVHFHRHWKKSECFRRHSVTRSTEKRERKKICLSKFVRLPKSEHDRNAIIIIYLYLSIGPANVRQTGLVQLQHNTQWIQWNAQSNRCEWVHERPKPMPTSFIHHFISRYIRFFIRKYIQIYKYMVVIEEENLIINCSRNARNIVTIKTLNAPIRYNFNHIIFFSISDFDSLSRSIFTLISAFSFRWNSYKTKW